MISNFHTHKARILSGASLGVLGALFAAQPVQLGPVSVQDESSVYQAESADPRRTAPLRDTPQTVTVITEELIADQNLLNLRDILANTVPGITFTAGEGGGGYGDGINLRGSATEGDCIRILARHAETIAQPTRQFFQLLTRHWQYAAYAHRHPTETLMRELCDAWPQHFGVAE